MHPSHHLKVPAGSGSSSADPSANKTNWVELKIPLTATASGGSWRSSDCCARSTSNLPQAVAEPCKPSRKLQSALMPIARSESLRQFSNSVPEEDVAGGLRPNQFAQLGSEFMSVVQCHRFKHLLRKSNHRVDSLDSRRPSLRHIASESIEASQQSLHSAEISGLLSPFLDSDDTAMRPRVCSAYTLSYDEARVGLMKRKLLYNKRTRLADLSLILAIIGILVMMLEGELTATEVLKKDSVASIILRVFILLSTLALVASIIGYHACEVELVMIDSGTDDWRVAMSTERAIQLIQESLICLICPFPKSGSLTWPYLQSDNSVSINGTFTLTQSQVPIDVILAAPMFLRFYLLGRCMVLHSHLFKDAATRSIAAMNRVSVDFKFVIKSMMKESPVCVLCSITLFFWITISWMFTQCERYAAMSIPDYEASHHSSYLNSFWLVIITFLSIGYGDIVPHSYCGRTLCVFTGVVGIGVASALIAVTTNALDLTKAEKHVNAFIAESKLAARVHVGLQERMYELHKNQEIILSQLQGVKTQLTHISRSLKPPLPPLPCAAIVVGNGDLVNSHHSARSQQPRCPPQTVQPATNHNNPSTKT